MTLYIELGALLVALFLLYLLLKFINRPLYVLANSIMGILIFLILNLLGVGIPINILSVGVVAVAGVAGVILVLILHFLGIAF